MVKILVVFGKNTDGSQLPELEDDVRLMFVDMGEKKAHDFIMTNNIKRVWATVKNGSKFDKEQVMDYLSAKYEIVGTYGEKVAPKAKVEDMKKKEPEHVFATEEEANKAIGDFVVEYERLWNSSDWGVEMRDVKKLAKEFGASRVTKGKGKYLVRFTLANGRYQNLSCTN